MIFTTEKDYYKLLKQFVELQGELMFAFESIAEISPSADLLELIQAEEVFRKHHSISKILSNWPNNVPYLALLVWVKPSRGVLQIGNYNWTFRLHGTLEINFTRLPAKIEDKTLDRLKEGELDLLINFIELDDFGPSVEAFFSGRNLHTFTSRTLYTYTQSLSDWKDKLTFADHEHMLTLLFNDNLIQRENELAEGEIMYFLK